jgi:hypothetical protein
LDCRPPAKRRVRLRAGSARTETRHLAPMPFAPPGCLPDGRRAGIAKARRRWRLRRNCCASCTVAATPLFLPARSRPHGSASSMPRPEYIARLHGASYDLRTCEIAERPEMLRRYKAALAGSGETGGMLGSFVGSRSGLGCSDRYRLPETI